MANTVAILGESGTLSLQARPVSGVPAMEFSSGSFRGSVDERRVCGVFLVIATGGKELELRFEFTDPTYATVDLKGVPRQKSAPGTVLPYTEPRQTRDPAEGR